MLYELFENVQHHCIQQQTIFISKNMLSYLENVTRCISNYYTSD